MAINFGFSVFVQHIWNCLDDFSFMTVNSMISMPVPGIVQLIQQVLLNFIYVDILLTDLWLPQLFMTPGETAKDQSGINSYFEQNGFGSKVLIINLGSSFVYLAIFAGIIVIYIKLRVIQLVFPR
jgi:hypothetical protein